VNCSIISALHLSVVVPYFGVECATQPLLAYPDSNNLSCNMHRLWRLLSPAEASLGCRKLSENSLRVKHGEHLAKFHTCITLFASAAATDTGNHTRLAYGGVARAALGEIAAKNPKLTVESGTKTESRNGNDICDHWTRFLCSYSASKMHMRSRLRTVLPMPPSW